MRVLCALALAAMCGGTSAGDQNAPASSLSGPVVKAVYLLNFARFTEWPTRSVDGPLTLCVLGDPQIATLLDKFIGDRPINGREVSVARIETLRLVQSCHLLYISGEGHAQVAEALQAVSTRHVFTVGDGEAFTKSGGVAALFTEDGRTRFAINSEALTRAGLRVSSQMMGLARLVKGQAR